MPSKRSTRFTVKHFAKQFTKHFAKNRFVMKHFTVKRPMAIGIIVVCIVGTAMLIVASSSEPTSAASVVPEGPIVALAPIEQTPAAKVQKPTATAKPASAQTAGAIAGAEIASIEGCLVQDDGQFRLKNTSGEDAPRGRSWKSGFLHQGSKIIDVLDETHRLNLARHVGERVAITGVLDDRELQGTALKRVAESCN
jgi:hypothetical protein